MYNQDLRVRKNGISFQKLANHLGVHLNTVLYWFNTGEMDGEKIRMVMNAIREIEQKDPVS